MKVINIILIGSLSLYVFADQKVKTPAGRIVILKDNGTWVYDSTKSTIKQKGYQLMNIDDLKADMNSSIGKKVKVQGIGLYIADVFVLGRDMGDGSPISVEITKIHRDHKKYIFKNCTSGCELTVFGTVGSAGYKNGIIADKIEWPKTSDTEPTYDDNNY